MLADTFQFADGKDILNRVPNPNEIERTNDLFQGKMAITHGVLNSFIDAMIIITFTAAGRLL